MPDCRSWELPGIWRANRFLVKTVETVEVFEGFTG